MAPAFRKYCLPYVPATTTQLENILSVLKHSDKSGRLLDIGSGDGRIVVGMWELNDFEGFEAWWQVSFMMQFFLSRRQTWISFRWGWIEPMVGAVFSYRCPYQRCINENFILPQGSVEVWCFVLQTHCDFRRGTNGKYFTFHFNWQKNQNRFFFTTF